MADNRLNSKIQRLVFNLISVLLKTYGLVFGRLFSEIKIAPTLSTLTTIGILIDTPIEFNI